MTKKMWVADFEMGGIASLYRVTVDRETDKTFHVTESEKIMGWLYFGRRTNKPGLYYTASPVEALTYLVGHMTQHIITKERELDDSRAKLAELTDMLREAMAKAWTE